MKHLGFGSTIGIIGGGQLARMLAWSACQLGYRIHIYTDSPDSSASQVVNRTTIGGYGDIEAVGSWAKSVDVVTFEWENIPSSTLDALEAIVDLRPGAGVLRTSQDRILEKTWINSLGIPTARWMPAHSPEELRSAAAAIGYPCVAKTSRLGYDGRGQRRMAGEWDVDPAWRSLDPTPLTVERFVEFRRELSIIVARGHDGSIRTFDIATNVHRNHILDTTTVPSLLPEETTKSVEEMAAEMARSIGLVGIMTIEMFEDQDGRILVNEIAPRPHNSGHWTMDACTHSQFDLQIRAVAGLPLPDPQRHSDAIMHNLLGNDGEDKWNDILEDQALIPHWYGKDRARPGRKMGHVTRLYQRGYQGHGR